MSNQLDMDAIRIAAERDRLIDRIDAVSYTHLTLPTNREV